MKKLISIILTVLGLVLLLSFAWYFPADAAPQFQLTPFPTPTAGPDGRILYVVQEGDTLWRISAVAGVTLDELRLLNNLEPDEVIIPGQVLILGLGGPAEPQVTAAPGETLPPAAQPGATETLGPGSAVICVLLYEDLNGDMIRQETEVAIEGGEASVTERTGQFSGKLSTEPGTEAVCIPDLTPGEYIVSMAIPYGYNETTALSVTFELAAGDITYLNFGAQQNAQTAADAPFVTEATEESGRSALMGILGIGLLLGGIGLGIYSIFMSRRPAS